MAEQQSTQQIRNRYLAELRVNFNDIVKQGGKCPVCQIYSRAYKVIMNRTYVHALQILAQQAIANGTPDDWFMVGQEALGKELAHDLNHMKYSKLAHWKLIEKRVRGHNRTPLAGQWKITKLGWDFLHGRARIRAYVWELRKKAVLLSLATVSVHQALGRRFNFEQEVLGGA